MKTKKLIQHQIITQINQNIFKRNNIVLIESDLLVSDLNIKRIKLYKLSLVKIFSKLNLLKYFKVGQYFLCTFEKKNIFFSSLLNNKFYPLFIKYKNIICLNKLYSIKKFFNTILIINKINYLFRHLILFITRTIFKSSMFNFLRV